MVHFRTAAERFELIDDSQQKTILVRYGEGDTWIDLLRFQGAERALLRRLQRYTVTISKETFNDMLRRRAISEIQPGMFALASEMDYSKEVGLLLGDDSCEAEILIV